MPTKELDPQSIPKEDPGTYWDTLVPGLHLRVSPKGKRTFAFRYRRPGGSQPRQKLGVFDPDRFTLAMARRKARDAQAALEEGRDPFPPPEPVQAQETTGMEESEAEGDTFRALAVEVLNRKAKGTRPKTQRDRRRMLDKNLLGRWGDRKPGEIKRADVVDLHQELGEKTPVLANRVLSLVQLIYNEGLRMGWEGLDANPAHLVERLDEKERDRCLDLEEIKTLWAHLYHEHPYVAGAIRLSLLTAQRIGSVRQMRWDQIKSQTWRIPADVFKGKREHWVPLSPEAQEILAHYRDTGSEWVFPAARGSEGPVKKTDAVIRRIWRKTKLPPFTAHDLRTTFKTWTTMAEESPDPEIPAGLGVEPDVADAVLGHKDPRLSLARCHGRPEEHLLAQKRGALEAWGAFVRASVEWRYDWRGARGGNSMKIFIDPYPKPRHPGPWGLALERPPSD